MSLEVILRPEAQSDIQQIYDYLEQSGIGIAEKFSERLRQVLQRLESQPELYGFVWDDVRAVRLSKMQYVVYYVVLSDRVDVLAVLHGFRHESAWQERV